VCSVFGRAALLLTGRRNARHRTHRGRLTAREQTGGGSGFDAKVCPTSFAVPVVCPPIPYHTIPYHTIPYHTTPHHTIPYHTIPYAYHARPAHTIPYRTIVMPCHVMSCHAMLYHATPQHTIPRPPHSSPPPPPLRSYPTSRTPPTYPPADAKRRTLSQSYLGA
jgi:hypothetical protein